MTITYSISHTLLHHRIKPSTTNLTFIPTMSLLTRTFILRSLAPPLLHPTTSPATTPPLLLARPFHKTPARAALSESDHGGHQDVEERKAKIEHHKEDQLGKQREGKGHWKRELGSNSEAAIKADREEITDAEHDIESLQKETSEALEEDHEHGKK
ncbi:hypothetical protein BDR22DRAFT_965664 [Usnea florida]